MSVVFGSITVGYNVENRYGKYMYNYELVDFRPQIKISNF